MLPTWMSDSCAIRTPSCRGSSPRIRTSCSATRGGAGDIGAIWVLFPELANEPNRSPACPQRSKDTLHLTANECPEGQMSKWLCTVGTCLAALRDMVAARPPGVSDARVPCPLCGGLIHP